MVKVGTSKLSHTEHNQRYQTCYCHTISFKVLITTEQFGRNENENYAKAIASKRFKLETIFKDLVSRFYINSRFQIFTCIQLYEQFQNLTQVIPDSFEVYSKFWEKKESNTDVIIEVNMFPLYCFVVSYFANATDRELGIFQRVAVKLDVVYVCNILIDALKFSEIFQFGTKCHSS